MAKSICEVAYGEELERNVLPNLLFLGVGPNPGQIIQDLPSLSEII